jgi:hypothetical protein
MSGDLSFSLKLYNTVLLFNLAYASQIVKMWYTEIQQYDFKKPGFSSATEHFTQVVWKSTRQVGCGIAMGPKNADGRYRVYGVCQYKDAGNVVSSTTDFFSLNVFPIDNIPVVPTTSFVLPTTTATTTVNCATDFQERSLMIHNYFRNVHHAPALVTSASLQISATAWAEQIAKSGNFQNSGTTGVGENLAMVTAFQTTLDNCGGEFLILD